MGIIGEAFGKLFGVIWRAIVWLGSLLGKAFQGIVDLLTNFFEVIFALISGLLYLLFKIGVLAVKFFVMIFETAKILWSLVMGLTQTLKSLTYTPHSSSGNGYSEMVGKLFNYTSSYLQIDSIAYILLFVLWVGTAVTCIKLVSSLNVGGD